MLANVGNNNHPNDDYCYQYTTTAVNILTFSHESSLVVVKEVIWHLLVAGLRDLPHVVESAVFHNVGQLLITEFFTQKQGDPLHC